MNDHTTQYPLDKNKEYAPWVAKHGLNAPYGECQCGCGEDVTIAKVTRSERGQLRGHPVRFVPGHGQRKYPIPEAPNPSGICMCGCGQLTPIAECTRADLGHVKGEHISFINGHNGRKYSIPDPPNPSGYCMCGCGQKTELATVNDGRSGHAVGEHVRYIHGHNTMPYRKTLADAFWFYCQPGDSEECWVWPGATKTFGYGRFRWNGQIHSAHRVSYELHYGEIPDGMFVCHTCDNPVCVNPNHLFIGKPADNSADMVAKGRSHKRPGEKHPLSKLTREDVLMIRKLHRNGVHRRKIAKRFDITPDYVNAVVRRVTWKHIP